QQRNSTVLDGVHECVNRCGDHTRCGRSRHPDEVSVSTRCHSLNIKSGQPPRAATQVDKPDQPAKLSKMHLFGGDRRCQRPYAPRVSKERGSHTETDDVGQGVELFSELAVCTHRARYASVQRIEKDGNANGPRGVVKIGRPAVESCENRVVAAKKVGDREHTGEDIDAAAQAVIAKYSPGFLFVADRI